MAGTESSNLMVITLENVQKLSVFQLRQELIARGEFLPNVYQGTINYQVLLARMVQILHDEKEAKDEAQSRKLEMERKDKILSLEQEKADRKAAALERSRCRQANKAYFESKHKGNVQMKDEEEKRAKSSNLDENATTDNNFSETNSDSGNIDIKALDPFALPFRSKIGGRSG
uniref:Uncharacterized protein n=1 Tax=Leptocylindrus danicus TaxID=163516 RepID=A0A7S2K1Y5_9STRA|mmetsp:Transcript_16233/g.23907  ORF Transcript_16233/g.23907 Transcript_16233/m.23907 type:complete len:173 (+) Transcript_16233:92-610(+)